MTGAQRQSRTAGTRASASESPAPTPPKRVRVKLDTIDNIKAEMARLYRQAKAGSVSVGDASKLGYLLWLMGRMIQGADLEKRVEELEAERTEQQRLMRTR